WPRRGVDERAAGMSYGVHCASFAVDSQLQHVASPSRGVNVASGARLGTADVSQLVVVCDRLCPVGLLPPLCSAGPGGTTGFAALAAPEGNSLEAITVGLGCSGIAA